MDWVAIGVGEQEQVAVGADPRQLRTFPFVPTRRLTQVPMVISCLGAPCWCPGGGLHR